MKINQAFRQAFYLLLVISVFSNTTLIAQVGLPSNPFFWSSIGPKNLSTTWDEQGQLNAVRFHPEYDGTYAYGEQPSGAANINKNTLFAASGPGGLLYSTNGGLNWQDFYTDDLIYPGCSDFEIATYTDEGVAKYDYYFIHRPYFTGYTGHPSWHPGSLIYRNLDGATWTDTGAPFDYGNIDSEGYHGLQRVINDLTIVPDPEGGRNYKILTTSNQGVHYSTDQGTTWNAATFDDSFYYGNINWHSGPRNIMVDRAATQYVYLTGDFGESLWGWIDLSLADANVLYRSVNGGQHFVKWKTINKGTANNSGLTMSSTPGPHNTKGFKIVNTRLLQSESNPNRFFLMVLTETNNQDPNIDRVHPGNSNGHGLTIFVTNNKGVSWEYGAKMSASGPWNNVFSYVLDPIDENRMYIGRGNTSQKVTLYDHSTQTFQLTTNSSFHPDARDMAVKKIGDQTHLMVGHDGGVDISTDISGIPMTGSPSNSFNSHTGNMIVNRAYTISVSQQEAGKFMIPMPDNSIMESSLDANGTRIWDKIDSGDGEHSQYSKDPTNDTIRTQMTSSGYSQVFIEIHGCSPNPTVAGETTPLNSQKTWHRFPIEWVNWDAPDSNTPFKTFLGQSDSENGVFRILYSDEGGCGEYLDLSGFQGTNGPIKSRITHLEVEPAVPNLVIFSYLNAKDGMPPGNKLVYGMLTPANTIEWKSFNPNNSFPSESMITDLEIVIPNEDDQGSYRLYVSFSNGEVYSCYYNGSTDQFSTWTVAYNGLPDTYVNCLAYDRCSNVLFAGTDHGVYYRGVGKKVVGGTSFMWQYLGKYLPNVTVTDLEIEPKLGMLYASTWGRGVYEKDVSDLICLTHQEETEKELPRAADIDENPVIKKNGVKVYPNPAPSGGTIKLSLSLLEEQPVSIELYDISGRLIKTVVDQQKLPQGERTFEVGLDDYMDAFLIVRTTIGKEVFLEKVMVVTASDKSMEEKRKEKEGRQ